MKKLASKGHEVLYAFRVNSKNTTRQRLWNSDSTLLVANSFNLLLNFLS